MIRGIIKEVLLVKAEGLKFETDLKGLIKTGRKSIIDMDSQEAKIIADAVELEMSTLTDWSLVNDYREVKDLPLVCISDVVTCISKLKHLVEKLKNEKQGGLDINAPTPNRYYYGACNFICGSI